MRRSLIPSLLANAGENLKITPEFMFFELGKIFTKQAELQFEEKKSLAGICARKELTEVQAILAGFIGSLLPRVKYELIQDRTEKPYLHPGKTGTFLVYGNKPLITFGYVHPEIAARFDIDDTKTIIFEIDFTLLTEVCQKSDYRFSEIAKYPGVSRELNFVFAKNLPVADVVKKILKTSNLISSPRVVDIFEDTVKVGE
jgi:phenylalanyl-tRNA synthetase beta chain